MRSRWTKTAEPLPECELCALPTRREVYNDTGGLCTECAQGIADTVRMLPVRGAEVLDLERARRERDRLEAQALDETVWVERYTPPVPGQLELPTDAPAPDDKDRQ